jgi:Helix-turn-helix domain of resolvase
MLSQNQRTTILELAGQGVSRHEIARVLKISRGTVKKVLRSGHAAVPLIERAEKCEPYRQQILELLSSCKGNLVRVLEELSAQGANLSYSGLTAYCRRHGIGQAPVVPAGRYHFSPGEELQHDTSPHQVNLGGKLRKVQTASAVLCYSRMLFFQMYPTFKVVPQIAGYVAALKTNSRKLAVLALRQLLRMVREYPREPLVAAVAEAARYGLYDLDRLERMILRRIARDYFPLNNDPEGGQ